MSAHVVVLAEFVEFRCEQGDPAAALDDAIVVSKLKSGVDVGLS